MWGRGGNLCKCSAVHFAGKRTDAGASGDGREEDIQALADALDEGNDLEGGKDDRLSDYRLNQLLRKFYEVRRLGKDGKRPEDADDLAMAALLLDGDSDAKYNPAQRQTYVSVYY